MPMTHDVFPRQTQNVGKKVLVCFDGDLAHILNGTIVRQDEQFARVGLTIILLHKPEGDPVKQFRQGTYLADRYIMGDECQFQIID